MRIDNDRDLAIRVELAELKMVKKIVSILLQYSQKFNENQAEILTSSDLDSPARILIVWASKSKESPLNFRSSFSSSRHALTFIPNLYQVMIRSIYLHVYLLYDKIIVIIFYKPLGVKAE